MYANMGINIIRKPLPVHHITTPYHTTPRSQSLLPLQILCRERMFKSIIYIIHSRTFLSNSETYSKHSRICHNIKLVQDRQTDRDIGPSFNIAYTTPHIQLMATSISIHFPQHFIVLINRKLLTEGKQV